MGFVFDGGGFTIGKITAQQERTSQNKPSHESLVSDGNFFSNYLGTSFNNKTLISYGTNMQDWFKFIRTTQYADPTDLVKKTSSADISPQKPGSLPTGVSTSTPVWIPTNTSKPAYLKSGGNAIIYVSGYGASIKVLLAMNDTANPNYGYEIMRPFDMPLSTDFWGFFEFEDTLVYKNGTEVITGICGGYYANGEWKLSYGFPYEYKVTLGTVATRTVGQCMEDFFSPIIPPVNPNPDLPGSGGVQPGGGQGTGVIPDGTTPGINDNIFNPADSVLGTGFLTAWKFNINTLSQLANFLWNPDIANSLMKLFSDPMDVIVSLREYPGTGIATQAGTMRLANLDPSISSSYYLADAGKPLTGDSLSFTISEVWGSFLDYEPFTTIEIYLPYIGVFKLDVAQVMNETLTLTYAVSIITGECVAIITNSKGIVGQYTGQMGVDVTITAKNNSEVIRSVSNAVLALGMGIATGGVSSFANMGSMAIGAADGIGALLQLPKTQYQRVNGGGSFAGYAGAQVPYLIITRPNPANPENMRQLLGYPSNSSGKLEQYEGLTICKELHLDSVSATDKEKAEIEELFLKGVIL